MKINPQSPWFTVLILATIPLSQLAIDIYTPSMPHMVQVFSVNVQAIQLTMTLYLCGLGIGMFVLGILSDHFGRRAIYQVGYLLSVIGSVLCLSSHGLDMFYLGRLVQGLGGGAIVCLPAIITDVMKGNRLTKVMSYGSMTWSLIPIIAPFIGGWVQEFFVWQLNFAILLAYGVLGFIAISVLLPETLPVAKRRPFHPITLTKVLWQILRNPSFLGHCLQAMLCWSVMIIFIVLTPFMFQSELNISAGEYGTLVLIYSCGYFVGAWLNSVLLNWFSSRQLTLAMLMGLFVGGLLLVFSGVTHRFSIPWILLPSMFAAFISAGVYPISWSGMVKTFPEEFAGVGSALADVIIMIGATLITVITSHFHIHTQWPMGVSYIVIAVIGLLLAVGLVRIWP